MEEEKSTMCYGHVLESLSEAGAYQTQVMALGYGTLIFKMDFES